MVIAPIASHFPRRTSQVLTYANKIDFYVNENDCYLVLFIIDEANRPKYHAVVYIPHTVAMDLADQISATKFVFLFLASYRGNHPRKGPGPNFLQKSPAVLFLKCLRKEVSRNI